MAATGELEIQGSFHENSQICEEESGNMQTVAYFERVKDILAKCTEKCFAPARFEKISSCLAEVREKNPLEFDSIVPQLVDHLQVNVKQELELMFEQENLVSLCHQLDQIKTASTNQEAAWRPTGVPSEDIKDHVFKVKLEFRDKLREKLKQLQNENQVLESNVKSMAREKAKTEQRIIEKHRDFQKISTACHNNEADSLENLIKQLNK